MVPSLRGGDGEPNRLPAGEEPLTPTLASYRKARRMLAVVTRRRCHMVDAGATRARLEKELTLVNKRIDELKMEQEPEELESGGDNTPLSEEIDSALVAQERELHDKILEGFLDRAAALERALQRLEDGTYGFCVSCHGKIPQGRVDVLPEVSLCAPCQTRKEEDARYRGRKVVSVNKEQ